MKRSFFVSVKDKDKVCLEWDSSVTNDGVKVTLFRVEFFFEYFDMTYFMDDVKKVLEQISTMGQDASHKKSIPVTSIDLQFEIPDKFLWNEHEKQSFKPGKKACNSCVRTTTFGRRMNRDRVVMKYLNINLTLADFEKNLVLAILRVVNAFNVTARSSDASCQTSYEDRRGSILTRHRIFFQTY